MLISPEYQQLNTQLHHDNPSYGKGSCQYLKDVLHLMQKYHVNSILDYGSGKSTLKPAIRKSHPDAKIIEYDPAFKDTQYKEPCDLVVALDVLEHIEPECLDEVVQDIRECTQKCFFAVISNRLAKKTLSDGRNAHLIVKNEEWWGAKLKDYFTVKSIEFNSNNRSTKVECV